MPSCPACASPIPEGQSACPKCPPATDAMMRAQIADLDRRWSIHPFASGWRFVDIGIRVVLIFVLVWLAISLDSQLEAAREQGRRRLDTHRAFIDQMGRSTDVDQVRSNYASLHTAASEMFEAEIADRKLHIAALLAFIALLAVSAIGSWRTHKELSKLRRGFEFLFTYEGRQVLDRVAPRQDGP